MKVESDGQNVSPEDYHVLEIKSDREKLSISILVTDMSCGEHIAPSFVARYRSEYCMIRIRFYGPQKTFPGQMYDWNEEEGLVCR